jgi:hypothetical protein
MIGMSTIPLPTKAPYYLYKVNKWDNKRPILLIKNVSCSRNDLKKLISHMNSICEDEFLKKYGRIVEITKMPM